METGFVLRDRESLADDLRRLGLRPGDTVLVHASLRAVGWVLGGPTAVVQALLDVVGPAGTLLVPAQTLENRDPSRWTDPAVPEPLWREFRDRMPAFDPLLTPCSRLVGALPERVRTWPGARRSGHPQTSFAALGARAAELVAEHPLPAQLGPESPLDRLVGLAGQVLLLGVGYSVCTVFHLAEYELPDPPRYVSGCAVWTGTGRRWVTYEAVRLSADGFPALGQAYEEAGEPVLTGRVGAAGARLLPAADAVRFARQWLRAHRRSGS